MNQELFIHYWQLPKELFVSLKDNFHKKFCLTIQNNTQFHRKHGETKKLTTASLLKQPKTLFELARELNIRRGSVSAHIRKLPFVIIVDQRILRRGAYTKVNVFGVEDIKKAHNFLNTKIHYTRLPLRP